MYTINKEYMRPNHTLLLDWHTMLTTSIFIIYRKKVFEIIENVNAIKQLIKLHSLFIPHV